MSRPKQGRRVNPDGFSPPAGHGSPTEKGAMRQISGHTRRHVRLSLSSSLWELAENSVYFRVPAKRGFRVREARGSAEDAGKGPRRPARTCSRTDAGALPGIAPAIRPDAERLPWLRRRRPCGTLVEHRCGLMTVRTMGTVRTEGTGPQSLQGPQSPHQTSRRQAPNFAREARQTSARGSAGRAPRYRFFHTAYSFTVRPSGERFLTACLSL